MQTMELEPESLLCSLARLEKHMRQGAQGCLRGGAQGKGSTLLQVILWNWQMTKEKNLTMYVDSKHENGGGWVQKGMTQDKRSC